MHYADQSSAKIHLDAVLARQPFTSSRYESSFRLATGSIVHAFSIRETGDPDKPEAIACVALRSGLWEIVSIGE